jgi:hypothetical protein
LDNGTAAHGQSEIRAAGPLAQSPPPLSPRRAPLDRSRQAERLICVVTKRVLAGAAASRSTFLKKRSMSTFFGEAEVRFSCVTSNRRLFAGAPWARYGRDTSM